MIFRVYRFFSLLSSNTLVIFIFLFIIAGIFRLFFLDLIEFKFDEAFNVYQLTTFYANPTLNFHSGLSSSGMHNFPLLHYILIPISLFSRDPQYISFIIALINTTLIPIFYLIVKKYYSNFIAFFSALILASSPWAIIYSRKIWHPDLILFFLIPIFYLAHKIVLEKNNRYQWLFFALMVLLFQQHFSGIYFLIATILVLVIYKVKFNFKQIIIGIALGIVPAVPYILYNLSSTPFCADCSAYISYQRSLKPFDIQSIIRPMQIISGSYFENVLGEDFRLFNQTFPIIKFFRYFFIAEVTIPLFSIFFVIKEKKKYLLLPIYYIVITALYLIGKTPARMYYFVILLPIMSILYALAFDYFWNLSRKFASRFIVGSVILFFILVNVVFVYYFYLFLSTRQTIHGDYGPIYKVTKQKIEKDLAEYSTLRYYDQLQSYAYVFAQSSVLHAKLGEFFVQVGDGKNAALEFQKALSFNPDDIQSRANLTYIYILSGEFNIARQQIDILSTQDASLSAKFKEFLSDTQTNRKQ